MAKKGKKAGLSVDLSRKKKKVFDVDTNIKVAYKTGNIVYGKNQVLKSLRKNRFKMIIIAQNCPKELEDQLNYYNTLSKDSTYIYRYKGSSWNLGLACAKPYMISVIAVADENPEGRIAAGKRLEIDNLYGDYRQMLDREKLDVVTVAPRWCDQREAMVTACAAAGCHVLVEKPFAIDAASADHMLAACRSANVKVAVVHQQRAFPGVREIKARLADGRLGKMLSMRARGKEDARAGGEVRIVEKRNCVGEIVHRAGVGGHSKSSPTRDEKPGRTSPPVISSSWPRMQISWRDR